MSKYLFIASRMDPIKLIENVRAHECLYNSDDSNYRKMARRQLAWKRVAAAMGAAESECRQNWSQLRNAFTHAVARRAKAGPNAEKFVKWTFEDEMSFIQQFIKPRKSNFREDDSNRDTDSDEIQREPIEQKGPQYTDIIQPIKIKQVSMLKQHMELNYNNNKARKRKSSKFTGGNQQMNIAATIMENRNTVQSETVTQDNNGQEKDDIDLLFESLAKTVKKLPKLERIKLKWDIMKMVNEVEARCLATNPDVTSTNMSRVNSEIDKRIHIVASKTMASTSSVKSEPIASTSSASIIPEQSFVKCKEEPPDEESQLSQDRVSESTEKDSLSEADTMTIMGNCETILNQNCPNSILRAASQGNFASVSNMNSKSNPHALPCRIVSVQSLTSCKEEPENS